MEAGEDDCLQHQICFERNLHAQRAYQQGCTTECTLWEKAAERWTPTPAFDRGGNNRTPHRLSDPLLRCIGDHLALRARQLTKRKKDLEKMGGFSCTVSSRQELGQLAPYYSDIQAIARATKDCLVHQALAETRKKRSALWTYHTRAAAQFQNVADYTRNYVEIQLGMHDAKKDDRFLASLAAQAAQYFVYAAEISTAVSDREARDDMVDLYTTAADLLETNLFSKEQSAIKSSALRVVLCVAEKAGQRYAAAARAKAQGWLPLLNAWMDAAHATSALVHEGEPRRANKRRTRVLTEEYSPDALARADALAARAQALEEEYYTCMDLCSEASAVESGL
jgi:hypothetical protein